MNGALTDYPFYLAAVAHWGIRGGGIRWEVDNWGSQADHTLHRVFVRSGPDPVLDTGQEPAGGATGYSDNDAGEDPDASASAPTTLGSCRELKAT